MLDWLSIQNIKDSEFGRALILWLFNVGKKNVMLFIGSPDAGKSYMARLIWQLFPIHTRIIQDGIFSFSNLVNSDCGLWDEPIITPELVDTIKLILEGEKDVNIAIKNKASQKLHKRVPLLITSNHELYRYCGSERDALDARCYKFYCNKFMTKTPACKNQVIHECSVLGAIK